jgi:lipid-A-disaccharide synthase
MRIAIFAGEASGDALGAGLMQALPAAYIGIGGEKMQKAGLKSLFSMEELTVMGFTEVLKNLPRLLKRIRETADFIIKEQPDVAVFIDAQDFCDRVAKRVKAKAPQIKLVKYVAPTVWAWRPARAAKLKPIYDQVLALFPFEPRVMEKLSGPPTTYIGHPLIREIDVTPGEKPYALLLPGSRSREIKYLLPLFGETIAHFPQFQWVLPTLPHLKARIEAAVETWAVKPRITLDKGVFSKAHVALAASGTVTLELALHGVPMVCAYKGGAIESAIMKRLVKTPSILLPNIILNEAVIPEFIQEKVTATSLSQALKTLNSEAQHAAFMKLRAVMQVDQSPDEMAAEMVRLISA